MFILKINKFRDEVTSGAAGPKSLLSRIVIQLHNCRVDLIVLLANVLLANIGCNSITGQYLVTSLLVNNTACIFFSCSYGD